MMTRAPPIAGVAALTTLTTLTALITLAYAQDLCKSIQIGNETQFALTLAERRVEPHVSTLEISEPDVCSASDAVGLKVTACDRQQAPRVYLLDAARGAVVREGSVATPAYVYITVYCASGSEEALDASVESPVVSNRFLEEALLQSSSIPSPPLPLPPTVRSVSTPTTITTQARSISTPDALPPLEVESPFVLTSSTGEYLPPVQLQSRFSSLDQSIPTILSSRLTDLWKGRTASSLGQLKSHSYPKSISSKSQENESSLLDKAKNQPFVLDSYSSLLNVLPKCPHIPSSSSPDTSSSSLAKRLTDLRPKQPSKWLANRSPAWLKRPTRRPPSPLLKLRSLPHGKTRKSMTQSRNRTSSRTSDYGDPWSPYDDDPLSLHWSDEPTDPNPWYTDGEPQSQYYVNSGGPWRSKHPQAHHFLEGPPSSLPQERPSPSALKHMSKKQTKYVPPIHEGDPALLAEWKRNLHRSPRPLLSKLLLLLQEQDHPALLERKCASAHSVEDDEPWWFNQPFKEDSDEGLAWQPDYPTDYSVDDGDSRSYLLERYTDEREQSPDFAPAYIEEPEHPRSPQCAPEHPSDARPPPRAPLFPRHPGAESPQVLPHPPLEYFHHYSPTPLTERPLLTSTVRHSLPWVKSSNPLIPMQLWHPSPKAEPSKHTPPPPVDGAVELPVAAVALASLVPRFDSCDPYPVVTHIGSRHWLCKLNQF